MAYPLTVVIPTSQIISHPSTEIIDKTIASVRNHMPGIRIIVTCDGFYLPGTFSREEWLNRIRNYEGYKQNIREAEIISFPKHVHQSGMMEVLACVKTPLVLYLEHDWNLLHPIEWGAISDFILSGEANYVKFHAGNRIHPLHEHMMRERVEGFGTHFIRTVQFSANPFICSTEWMRSLTPFFEGKCDFIENLLHGPIAVAPWEQYKLTIYNPVHGDMRRVQHLDGRKGEAQ